MVAPTAMLAAKNNALSTLAGAVDGATNPVTFSVAAGDGTLFPAPATDGPFMVTIDSEILKCTARTVDSLTCSRAQEGTLIASHLLGAAIQLRVTAKQIADIQSVLRGLGRWSMGQSGLITPASVIGGGVGGFSVSGLFDTVTAVGTGANARTVGANGVSTDRVTGAGAGDDAGVESVVVARTELSPVLAGRIYLPTTTALRGFFGLTDQNLATMVGAADPAGNYAGLAFNPVASANWRFVRKDNVTQTFTDTALAISSAPRFFLLEAAAASLTMSFYDAAFALLFSATVTTVLPTSTANLNMVCGLEADGAGAARTIGVFSIALANHVGRVSVL